jgi:hypothetical protein
LKNFRAQQQQQQQQEQQQQQQQQQQPEPNGIHNRTMSPQSNGNDVRLNNDVSVNNE